jgi:hypothetical protein
MISSNNSFKSKNNKTHNSEHKSRTYRISSPISGKNYSNFNNPPIKLVRNSPSLHTNRIIILAVINLKGLTGASKEKLPSGTL